MFWNKKIPRRTLPKQKKKLWTAEGISPLKKRTQELNINKKYIYSFFVGLFVVLIILTLFQAPFFRIQTISMERDNIMFNPETILKAFWELKGQNIFLANAKKIEKTIEEQEGVIKDIITEKKFPNTIILKLYPFETKFIVNTFFYQEESVTPLTQTGGESIDIENIRQRVEQKLYMNEQGFVSEESSSEWKKLELFLKEEVQQLHPWDSLFPKEYVDNINTVIKALEKYYEKSIEIENIDLYPKGREIRIKTNKWALWITFEKDIHRQIDKIGLFQRHYGSEKKVQYLDLRIKDKIDFLE